MNNVTQAITFTNMNQQAGGGTGFNPAPANTNIPLNQPGMGYAGIVNPCTGYPVDKVTADRLYMEAALSSHKMELEMKREYFSNELKKELEDKKTKNAMKRDEAIENRRLNRALSWEALIEDENGFLRIVRRFPNNTANYSKPIINHAHIRMTRFQDWENPRNIADIIKMDGFSGQIVMYGKSLSAKGLARALEQKGVRITVCREKKKQTEEMLYTYLIENAAQKEVPSSTGWYQKDNQWFFVSSEAQTIRGIMKGVYTFD